MYKKVGEISEEARQALLRAVPELVQVGGQPGQEANYQTTGKLRLDEFAHPEVTQYIPRERWVQGICVGIKPGGHLHLHTHDRAGDQGKTRYHVVLKTNDHCECWNGEKPYKLEDRGVYWMEPYLPHESFNGGETDRLHVVLITADVPEDRGIQ